MVAVSIDPTDSNAWIVSIIKGTSSFLRTCLSGPCSANGESVNYQIRRKRFRMHSSHQALNIEKAASYEKIYHITPTASLHTYMRTSYVSKKKESSSMERKRWKLLARWVAWAKAGVKEMLPALISLVLSNKTICFESENTLQACDPAAPSLSYTACSDQKLMGRTWC